MFDVQTVHMREIVPLRDVSVVAVLRYEKPDVLGHITSVSVDQLPASFLILADSLLVALPKQANRLQDQTIVSGFVVSYSVLLPSGVTQHQSFDSQEKTQQAFVLRLVVDSSAVVEEVWVNGRKALFTAASATTLLCSLPSGTDKLERIMIVARTNVMAKAQMFSFLASTNQISGAQKMTAQFLKLFNTTPGTDLFHPALGGGAQKIVGTEIGADSTLAATLVRAVTRTANQMIVGQAATKVPSNERLMKAEVLRVTSNPDDPTTAGVELKLVSQSSTQSVLSLLLGL